MPNEHNRRVTDRSGYAPDLCKFHDEEIKAIKREVDSMLDLIPDNFAATFAVLVSNVSNIDKVLNETRATAKAEYVTRTEFDPYKKLLDKVLWLILAAVIMGVLGLIWKVKV